MKNCIVVGGSSVEDVTRGVEAMKRAMASGAVCGVGGSTMVEVEQGLEALRNMGIDTSKVAMMGNCGCPCFYTGYCEDEDENEVGYYDGYRAYVRLGCGLHEPCETTYDTENEALIALLEDDYPVDTIQIEYSRVYPDGCVEVIEVIKNATATYYER